MSSLLSKIGGRNRAAEDTDNPEAEAEGVEAEAAEAAEDQGSSGQDAAAAADGADKGGKGGAASAFAAGAKAERERVAAILNADEAKGRDALARSLALDTDMGAEQARTVLGKAPKESGGLAAAMAGVENPDVGPDGGGASADDATVESVASRIVGKRRNSNQ